MARSPLDNRPDGRTHSPTMERGGVNKGYWYVECGNGEKVYFGSREKAWQGFYKIKSENGGR